MLLFQTYSRISCGPQTTSRIMIVLVSTFYLLVAVASAKDTDCCRLSVGFDACRNACNKLNALTDVRKKAQQLLELPLNCPAHLVTFWSCLNSSIPIFNGLSRRVNVTKFPASCCLLVVSGRSCRDACFSGNMAEIEKNCREGRMSRCMKRYEASQKCCTKATSACISACQVVFASDHAPEKSQKQNVITKCRKQKGGTYVKRCVRNMTDSPVVTGNSQVECCSKATKRKCQSTCNKEVLDTKTKTPSDIVQNLMKDCGTPYYDQVTFWTCFMTYHSTKPPVNPLKGVDGAKLQCCSKARSTKCWQLCVKMHSSKAGRVQNWENFDMECTYTANEAAMMRCISDVTEPCQLGCSGLSFCTNFNNRHTDLFRSCNAKSDLRAKHQLQEWKKGLIRMPSRVIAVQNIRKCLPETWKAIACVLQIKPCSSRTHKSTICRSDCIKILKQCGNSTISHKQNPFEICDELSPSEGQSGCLSISDYLRPSEFVGNVKEVTHPCQPSPCNKENICDIDRDCYEATPTLSGCQRHSCKPGCRLGDASTFYVRMGEYARVPLVDGKEGYFQACFCDKLGKLAKCKSLEYVQTKACFVDGRYRDDNTQFYVDCNFCTCFDGERICTRRHCSTPLKASSSSTGRPKRYQFVYGNSSQDLKNLHEGMPCGCKPDHIPVCGSDGITYPNPCVARCAGLLNIQSKQGSCASLDPCNPNPCRAGERCVLERKVCLSVDEPCNQYYCEKEGNYCDNIQIEPVCDQDNRQHPNLCSLHFSKKQLAYKGFCKDECKPPNKPVCGVNGETYSSKCAANSVRVLVDYEGHCRAIGYQKVEEDKPEIDQLLHCAGVKCPNITPAECNGIVPPGACCPLCAAQVRILFSTRQLKINSDGVTNKGPITLHHLLLSLRRHVTTSECDLFGYVSMDGDIVVHIIVVTKQPTPLQIQACNTEAQKIEVFINTGSPTFGSDIALSTLKGAKSQLPNLAAKAGGAIQRSSSALLLVFSLLKVYFTLKYILTNR